jgi:hypothetical protein
MSTPPTRQTALIPVERPAMLPMPAPLWPHYCSVQTGAEVQPAYSAMVHAQAKRELDDLAPLLVPVSEQHLRQWLAPLPLGVSVGSRTEEQIKGWFAGVCLACAGLPASLFNRATQAEALRTFQFFPSAADIYQLVAEDKAKLAARAMILRKMLDTPTEEP